MYHSVPSAYSPTNHDEHAVRHAKKYQSIVHARFRIFISSAHSRQLLYTAVVYLNSHNIMLPIGNSHGILKLSWSMKSDKTKAVQRRFITFVRYSKPRRILVRRLSGRKSSNSRMIYSICLRPFLGGINFSIRSERR